MTNAFMEGIHAAKKWKKALDNPYSHGYLKDDFNKTLWDEGFIFQLEQEANASHH